MGLSCPPRARGSDSGHVVDPIPILRKAQVPGWGGVRGPLRTAPQGTPISVQFSAPCPWLSPHSSPTAGARSDRRSGLDLRKGAEGLGAPLKGDVPSCVGRHKSVCGKFHKSKPALF